MPQLLVTYQLFSSILDISLLTLLFKYFIFESEYGFAMSECKSCKYARDVKGCASTHAETALKLIAEGKVEEAQKNLENLQTHLKE